MEGANATSTPSTTKKSSKMTRPPPPPPPPAPAEDDDEAFWKDEPAGVQQTGAAAGGYEGGRPPPPPVPQGPPSSSSAPSKPASAPSAERRNRTESGDAGEAENASRKRDLKPLFEQHIDKAAIEKGLLDKTLIRGTLRISAAKPSSAFFQPDGCKAKEHDLIVAGRAARNRAVHGDIVIVELIKEGEAALRGSAKADAEEEVDEEEEQKLLQWLRPPPGLGPDSGSSDEEEVCFGGGVMSENKVEGEPKQSKGGKKGGGKGKRKGGDDRPPMQHAMVVAIADPKGRERVMVCTLHPNAKGRPRKKEGEEEEAEEDAKPTDEVLEGDNVLRAIPTDTRMPWVLIQVNEVTKNVLNLPGKLDKYKLWPVQIVKWNETSHLPLGRLKGECLGTAGDLEAEERHALIEHELDTHDVDFDDDLQDEVDAIVRHADANFENEAAKRLDLRKAPNRKRVFTIDPATARDLDDAIHVDRVHGPAGEEQVEIGVHIADVGHFLKLGSIADKEAQKRTTSIYLINRVLPMLPHALCNHLCSLNPNEPKVSFSAFFST